MSNFIENFGLDFLTETDEESMTFVRYLASEGKAICGYYDLPYLFKSLGSSEFWLRTERIEDNRLGIEGIDTHCAGPCVWEMKHTGIDISTKSCSKLSKTAMFTRIDGEGGFVPIEIINADVLPSFLEGDKFRMQVVALPLYINYYASEDEYSDVAPEDKNGKKWAIALGSMFPARFLANHTIDKEGDKESCYDDRVVAFAAKVTKLYSGKFELEDMKGDTFIRCVAETNFGEIEFEHTFEQIPEEQRDNIKVGAVISGACVISADVAIEKYGNGIIKDFEHNLSLLRYTLKEGDPERLRCVLAENAVYETYSTPKSFVGRDAIVDWLKEVQRESTEKRFVHYATITELNEETKYPVDTRCLVLAYSEIDHYEGIVFVTVNEEGLISKIEITNDSNYCFRAEFPTKDKLPFELPESISNPMISRAKFMGIIDEELSDSEILDISEYNMWANNAERMFETLVSFDVEDKEKVLENIFGYLFAKAIEKTINESNVELSGTSQLIVSYSPSDAVDGIISSGFTPEEHQRLESAMEIGSKFFKDLKFFTNLSDADNDGFRENYIEAAVLTQRFGVLYSEKFLEQDNI